MGFSGVLPRVASRVSSAPRHRRPPRWLREAAPGRRAAGRGIDSVAVTSAVANLLIKPLAGVRYPANAIGGALIGGALIGAALAQTTTRALDRWEGGHGA